ncbi:hypothetical protein Tco_0255961 [Tanacetum coccineum]
MSKRNSSVLIYLYVRLSAKINAINLDTSSDNSSSDSNNNTSDSASTSQISTSEEIDYDSPEGSKSRGNESDAKPSFSDISKAKACMLAKAQASDASSKAKVQACGSKAKLQTSSSKVKLQRSPKTLIVKSHVPITNCVLGLANVETWDAILSKTFGVKIPPTMACAEEKKGKRKISKGSSDDKKGPSKASVPIFEGPSVQGLLDHYGYSDIDEYLSWNYFPIIDKENTDKDITDEDCIHESNQGRRDITGRGGRKYVPVSQKHTPKVKSPVPVTGCVLGLTNVTTWDEIVNKMGVMKSEIYVEKAKGKRKLSYGS